MSKESSAIYIPTDLAITSAQPTPFREPSSSAIKFFYGESGVKKKREAHIAHNVTLKTIHIDDETSQRSLFAQAVSAVNKYPKERREYHPDFSAFAYFTEPNGSRFLVGDVEGRWDLENHRFEMRSVYIHHVCDTEEEIRELMGIIQSLNPGVPKISSDSFDLALEASKRTD